MDVMSLVLVLSPNTDPTKAQLRTRPGQVYLQDLPAQDLHPVYCYLESVIRVKPRQLHQMADSTNPSFRWVCHLMILSLSDMENYWGFQGYSPFHNFYDQMVSKFANWNLLYRKPRTWSGTWIYLELCQLQQSMLKWYVTLYLLYLCIFVLT